MWVNVFHSTSSPVSPMNPVVGIVRHPADATLGTVKSAGIATSEASAKRHTSFMTFLPWRVMAEPSVDR
jgi:hypothetical protein